MLRKVLAMGLVSAMVIVRGITPAAWAGDRGRDGEKERHNKPPHKWGKHGRADGHDKHGRADGHGRYAGIPAGHLPPPEYRRGYLNVPPGHLPPPEYRH